MGNALIHILWGLVTADPLYYFSALFLCLVPVLSITIYAILDKLHNLSSLAFSSVNQGDASTFQHRRED